MCRICTDPIESLVPLETLICSYCPDLVAIPDTLVNLKTLHCPDCPRLSVIPGTLVRLTSLVISDCPQVTAIPTTLVNLRKLHCDSCPQLPAIPDTLVNLIWLTCANSPQVTAIPATLVNLTQLDCSRCPRMTALPDTMVHLEYLKCAYQPWMPQSAAAYHAGRIARRNQYGRDRAAMMQVSRGHMFAGIPGGRDVFNHVVAPMVSGFVTTRRDPLRPTETGPLPSNADTLVRIAREAHTAAAAAAANPAQARDLLLGVARSISELNDSVEESNKRHKQQGGGGRN